MTENTPRRYGDLLAGHFESTAGWRWNVAERFPDDVRNRRCAEALNGAAAYARTLPDDAPQFGTLRGLDNELSGGGWELASGGVLHGGATASRFWFDNSDVAPIADDFDGLINGVVHGVIESFRDVIESDVDQSPPSLVKFFEGAGFPLRDYVEDDEEL